MSTSIQPSDASIDGAPKLERWLVVTAASLIPASLVVFAPFKLQLVLVALAGILLSAGFFLLILQERRKRRKQ